MTFNPDTIAHRLTNHPPATPIIGAALDAVTDIMIATGEALEEILPAGRERALAITKLEECSMWAKAAIARNQSLPPLTP